MGKYRNNTIDVIKGLAILSVVAFHLGLFKWGYWGVDVFYVLAGYFSIRGMRLGFLRSRFSRLMPIVVAVTSVCLIVGIAFYLPIQMMDISRNAVCACVFASNFDMWRTANDYWATSNELNPMMHLWYLATLVQFYVVLAALYWRGEKRWTKPLIITVGIISLGLYLFKVGDMGMRYYLLPWRFWEFTLGAVLLWWPQLLKPFTGIKCYNRMWKVLAVPGAMSLSIYIWHQPLFAFVRYMCEPQFSLATIALVLLALSIVSWLSFRVLERKIESRNGQIVFNIGYVTVLFGALVIYLNSGVSHDIPELGVEFGYHERGFIYKYNDRIRAYDSDFANDGRIKVLLVGDSYARDWGNVLLESSASNRIDLVYCVGNVPANRLKLIGDADVIFYSTMLESLLPKALETDYTWVIGTKYYGFAGWVYTRRFFPDYHEIKVPLPAEIRKRNQKDSERYGERFIDMIEMVKSEDGRVRCFTDDNRFYTIDYGHLSYPGAQAYAKMIEENGILKKVLK